MFGQPSIGSIVAALRDIEAAVGGAASKPPRSNILKVIGMLEKAEVSSVDQYVSALKAQRKLKKKKRSSPKPADADIVESYLSRLHSAQTTPQDFERVLDQLISDKKARTPLELRQIVNRYTGGRAAYKNKAEARQALERKYHGKWLADQYDRKVG